jgi:hypothetical protein
MTLPPILDDNPEPSSGKDPEIAPGEEQRRLHASSGLDKARSAGEALVAFGVWAQWGLTVLGVLAASGYVLEPLARDSSGPSPWGGAIVRSLFLLVAYALAGWGARVLLQLTAVAIIEYLERVSHVADALLNEAARAGLLLGRIAAVLEQRGGSALAASASEIERARLLAEINRAMRKSEWVEADTLLGELAAASPDDPAISRLKDALASARGNATREQLAQLEAAREVNDPARVLEIYQVLSSSLDFDARVPLEHDVAKWLLNVIRRRLSLGKVQADVVHLAARVAETFATTAEGASVRTALPMLRRSVGLCPRCGQPYTGIAEACPQCLAAPASPSSGAPLAPQSIQPG